MRISVLLGRIERCGDGRRRECLSLRGVSLAQQGVMHD